jgi:hypothetical protein
MYIHTGWWGKAQMFFFGKLSRSHNRYRRYAESVAESILYQPRYDQRCKANQEMGVDRLPMLPNVFTPLSATTIVRPIPNASFASDGIGNMVLQSFVLPGNSL